MRINSSVVVRAPRAVLWELVTDPAGYRSFMSGITRWDVVDHEDAASIGLGSRIRMLIRVGAAEVGGLIEVVECTPNADLAWSSVLGVDQRGRWRLRKAGAGLTRVELRYSYGVAGAGLSGLLAERVAAPGLRTHLRRSLHRLKREAEARRLDHDHGVRRAARSASKA